ncbi:MAG: hypothetical protein AAGD05_02295 [Bacteroidota bacterium]
MGFYNLLSASKLSAVYDSLNKQLILSAEGTVKESTTGINFEQDRNFVGGLKFSLGGWTGPLTGETSPYKHVQKFNISLPSPVINSKSVIIADAENPNGKEVMIEYVLDGAVPNVSSKRLATASTNTVGNHKHVTALYKQPFEIRQSVPTTTGGNVNIQFDKTALDLVNAIYDNGEIVWTFNSLHTGNTQVVLTIGGGIATYVYQVVYDVSVIVLDQQNMTVNTQLSFLGMVNIAVKKVRAKYPNAELYEVDAVATGGPTTNPNSIDKMKVVFRAGRGTAIITSTTWGEFGPVQYIDQPWLEDVVIPWPIEMDLVEANNLKNKAGFTGTYTTVTLRWPLYPGVKQPSYIFGMTDGEYVFVGVYDGKVSTNMSTPKSNGKKKTPALSAN